ncbi:MAG: site-2 protease family protein [Chloroflexota bacterium]
MKNSWKLFSVRGVDVRLHFTFPLILIFAGFQFGVISGNVTGAIFGVVAFSTLFALVTLHELGHSFAAQYYGIDVRQIVLSPIGGVAQLERMPDNPQQELVIASAGPAVNFIIAVILGAVALAGGTGLPGLRDALPGAGGYGPSALFAFIFVYNIILALFNLLPAFPLDGGRILRALLAMRMDYVRATWWAANIGRVAAVGLGLYGLFNGGIFMMLIALFIFTAAGQEAQYVTMRQALKGYTVEHVYSESAYRLMPETTIRQAADLMLLGGQTSFAVVQNDRLVGFVPQADLIEALQGKPPYTPIGEIMSQDVEKAMLDEALVDVEMRMAEAKLDSLPVVQDDVYRGLVSTKQIGMLRRLVLSAPEAAPTRSELPLTTKTW